MDLIGKEAKLPANQVVTETIIDGKSNTKTILIKGIVTKKVVF